MIHPLFAIGLPHGSEWLIILVLAILFFGADKLPKLARGLGKSLGEFKKAKEDFEKELHSATSTDSTVTPVQPALDDKMRTPPAGTEPTKGAGSMDELTKKL